MKKFIVAIIYFFNTTVTAQDVGIGEWKDYLPHKSGKNINYFNNKFYINTEYSIFTYSPESGALERKTKITGLSDVEISVAKSTESTLVIGYKNGNLDLMTNSDEIINIPDIKNAPILGEKKINEITFHNDYAYLSTSFGIIQVNIEKEEISNTIYLNEAGNLNVNAITFFNDSIFAATDEGVFVAGENSNLLDYNNWLKAYDISTKKILSNEDYIYLIANDSLRYRTIDNTKIIGIKNLDYNNSNLRLSNNEVYLLTSRKIFKVDDKNTSLIYENDLLMFVTDIAVIDNIYRFSDLANGLVENNENIWGSKYPSGPRSNSAYKVNTSFDKIWIASGGIKINDGWQNAKVNEGVYWSDGVSWNHISSNYLGSEDIVDVCTNPTNSEEVFISTWNEGIIQLNWSEKNQWFSKTNQYDQNNTYGNLATLSNDPTADIFGWIRVKSIVFDQDGNLWGANSQVQNPLFVRRNDGSWDSYSIENVNTNNFHLGDLIIDNENQKWFIVGSSQGVVVWRDGQSKLLTNIPGSGNLPSNTVSCLASDLNGDVWVGTNQGVAVFYSPENIFSSNNYDSEQILIEVGDYVEYLLGSEAVTSIAVDPANRKWLGTETDGIYLVSENGDKIINHFNVNNSPIFSNKIIDIEIHNESGEVFISTGKGVVSYKGFATTPKENHQNVLVYPNPVEPNYNGLIGIKGLVQNANFKITDINGNLVFSSKANGGQGVWDGTNSYGERVGSGVYLIFSTNALGTETNVAKILFINND